MRFVEHADDVGGGRLIGLGWPRIAVLVLTSYDFEHISIGAYIRQPAAPLSQTAIGSGPAPIHIPIYRRRAAL